VALYTYVPLSYWIVLTSSLDMAYIRPVSQLLTLDYVCP
jgi:hypothetical protein